MSGKTFRSQFVKAFICSMLCTLTACGGSSGSDDPNDSNDINLVGNQSPVITALTEQQISEFQHFELTATISDADDDALTVDMNGLPSWLTFDADNARIYGTPGGDDAGEYNGITFTVSDGELTDTLTISLTVTNAVEVNGKVIDGYISGAIVYLDLNDNNQFDENLEPSALSNNNGAFLLVVNEHNVMAAQTSFIRAYIGTDANDISRDNDNFNANPITLSYPMLSAMTLDIPVINDIHITPFSHLVAEQIAALVNEQMATNIGQIDELKQQALANISLRLSLTELQLFSDYYAASTNLTDNKRQWMKTFATSQTEQINELQSKTLDNDNDGVENAIDADVDGDQIANVYDHFPLDNSESFDTDLDGIGNNKDIDDDNDAVIDSEDDFPLDARYAIATDLDNDGWPQGQDLDDQNASTPTEKFIDSDGDGYADNGGLLPDNDDDNDNVIDSEDAFPLDATESKDTDNDGVGNNADHDDDGDLVADFDDAFPLDATESKDTDGDGIGNNADFDDDNDGIIDEQDDTPEGGIAVVDGSDLSFEDATINTNLERLWGVSNFSDYTSETQQTLQHTFGGIASGDYDNDGDIDLFIVGGDKSKAHLYQNNGNGQYQNVANAAGVDLMGKHSGPSFADTDGDGDLDLFVGGIDQTRSKLLINQGDGTFVEMVNAVPVDSLTTVSSAFADFDLDGDLDLLLAHYGSVESIVGDHLWLNDGNNQFIAYDQQSLLAGSMLSGSINGTVSSFAPSFVDVNNDRYPDILMASDYQQSTLFLNNQELGFTDATSNLNIRIDDVQGMGSAIADFDNDGDFDWFISSIFSFFKDSGGIQYSGNKLLSNNGLGVFKDVSYASSSFDSGWSWGSCAADFNNDGLIDLFVTNGYFLDFEATTGTETFTQDTVKVFINLGNNKFSSFNLDIGLTDSGQGRAVACFDHDNDGDIDIVLTNHNDTGNSIKLLENSVGSSLGHYLKLSLKTAGNNTFAIGAKVTVTTSSFVQTRLVNINSNFTSHNPTQIHFGLGSHTEIESVTIHWPNGEVEQFNNLGADQTLLIEQNIK